MTRCGSSVWIARIAGAVVGATLCAAVLRPPPLLLWNASASTPIGLYRVSPWSAGDVGDLVAVTPPAPLARWLADRRYLPLGVPLLKFVAARSGQRICRAGAVLSIDGRPVAIARARDGQGRPLPVWHGCRVLKPGELLLLNPAHRDSLDGRYFGPLPASAVIGRAAPLYLPEPSPPASTTDEKEIDNVRQHL